jgi:hypothetical protein
MSEGSFELNLIFAKENVLERKTLLIDFVSKLGRLCDESVDAQESSEGLLAKQYFQSYNDSIYGQLYVELIECELMELFSFLIQSSKMTGFKQIGTLMCRSLIRDHMTLLLKHLTSGKHLLIQSTLRLFVSLGMHSKQTTKELSQKYNFSLKQNFLTIRKKSKKEDIRTLYIKFLFSFIVRGDSQTKSLVLGTREMGNVLKDLKNDSYELAQFVLTSLEKGVLLDKNLQKSPKIMFFNMGNLSKFIDLYHSKILKTPENVKDSPTVVDLIHSFMHILISTNGLKFTCNGWHKPLGQSKIQNHILSKLLPNLDLFSSEQRQLFLLILSESPELIHNFWLNCNLNFEPRSSIHYLSNLELTTRILSFPVPEYFGGDLDFTTPLIDNTLNNIMPFPVTKTHSKALQHSSNDVKYACGTQILSSFEKLQKVIEYSHKIESDSKEQDWTKWRAELIIKFRLLLPDIQLIIALYKPVLEEDGLISDVDVGKMHLKLLKQYAIYNPESVLESRYDFGKLMGGDPKTQTELLDLLVVVDFKWWLKPKDGEHSHFGTLLNWYTTKKSKEVVYIFERFFCDSLLFHGFEVQFWELFQGKPLMVKFMEDSVLYFHQHSLELVDLMLKVFENENEKIPFPPVILLLLSRMESEQESFVVEMMLYMLPQLGDFKLLHYFEVALEYFKKESLVFDRFSKWIKKIKGDKIIGIPVIDFTQGKKLVEHEELTFKKLKKHVKKGNVLERLLEINVLEFEPFLEDFIARFPEEKSKAMTYLQLSYSEYTIKQSSDHTLFFLINQMFLSTHWLLLEIFDQDKIDWQKIVVERLPKNLKDLKPIIKTLFFWMQVWINDEHLKMDPCIIAMDIIIEIVNRFPDDKSLADLILTHPTISSNFLVVRVDEFPKRIL